MQPEKSLNELTPQEREYFEHPTLGNLFRWDDDELTFVLDRLSKLLGTEDLSYVPLATGYLIQAALQVKDTNARDVSGALNAVWMAVHYFRNLYRLSEEDEKTLDAVSDFLCRYSGSEYGAGYSVANPFYGNAPRLKPNGGTYEIDVLKRLLCECPGDHPAHEHLYEAIGHLQRQPLPSHTAANSTPN